MANKITTSSYLVKRLRRSGFMVIKTFSRFAFSDNRKWSIIIDPTDANIIITCYENYPEFGDFSFEINDGGIRWPRNFMLKTRSIEVIILMLLEKNVSTYIKGTKQYNKQIEKIYGSKS